MSYRIVFATKNKGKIREINEIMADLDISVVSMEDAGIDIDVVEDGSTFEENSLKKAREVSKFCSDIVMADDSGLEVDYLDKAPGIYSARFGGPDASDADKNNMILDKLKGVDDGKRSARFVCAVATVFPDGEEFVLRETIEGRIGYEQKGSNGFGYDPIFYVPEFDRTTAELTADEKNKVSHRGKALKEAKIKLCDKLGL